MTDWDEHELLGRVGDRLATEPGFIAHDLWRWTETFGEVPAVVRGLGTDEKLTLALCRTLRRGESFATDVRDVASFVGADEADLARFFRTLDAAAVLAGARLGLAQAADGLLAAARDAAEDEATFVESPPQGAAAAAGALPGWLALVTEQFWAGTTQPMGFPRDLELQILLTHPVAVIELADLRVSSVRPFLGGEADAQLKPLPDRALHACLLALGGIGVVFVNTDDSPEDRRVNLAHEMGHFLTDYASPRARLAAHDPALVDVMDGLRAPDHAEELGALIADVPLGVQTHLLERDRAGGYRTRSAIGAEDRAEQVAWELLAPRGDVLARSTERSADALALLLRRDFGLPHAVAVAYGRFLATVAGQQGDDWLDGLNR